MKKPVQLIEQRQGLKQDITEHIENTFVAGLLRLIGYLVQRLTNRPTPWYISAILLELFVITPQAILAFILQDFNQVLGQGLPWSSAAVVVTLVVSLSYWSSKYILSILRDHIIESITELNNFQDLKSFLLELVNWKKTLWKALLTSLVWSCVAVPAFNYLNQGFIGISYAFDVWLFGFFALGVGMHYLIWFMRVPVRFRFYQYELYQLNPSRSEVIIHLASIFERPFLATAVYLAFVTLVASFFKIFNWVIFIIVTAFWIPLLVQFLNSQSTINKIIMAGKWRTLADLQKQISERQKDSNLNSPAGLEMINKLMDLHERVYSSRNNTLTINHALDLLNQLFLPLLAFIISNYGDVLKFLKLKP